MSKSSTATAPKIPTQLPAKSAWARGPPQSPIVPSRSQSPAPTTPIHTHSRRPSTLGQGVPIKDGVSVPRSNVGAVKQGKSTNTWPTFSFSYTFSTTSGSAVTFGSIDDVSAPISSSPAAAPAIKSEGVKSFGSVPATGHVNGKPSISSKPSVAPSSTSTTSTTPVTTPSTPSKLQKVDIKKMFQNPPSAPSSHPPSDTSSPATRSSNLPSQQQPSQHQQGQSQPPPSQSSQMSSMNFTPFVPGNMRAQQQNSGPGGSGPVPRSPVYTRQLPNGNGARPQNGPNGGPSQVPAGLSSPRLGPHPHSGQPSGMPPPPPQMQPQMQPQMAVPGWPGYYVSNFL